MSTISIFLIVLLIIIVLVPQRLRFALNQVFAFLVIPFRDLSTVTGNYIFNYPDRSRRLLNSAGISQPPYFGKSVGTLIVTAVTIISIMADLELVILTLEGVGIGESGDSLAALMPLKPAVCMAIALIGGAAMLGILFFDYFKPVLLPDNMVWPPEVAKKVMLTAAVMLIGAVIAMGVLAKFRSNIVNAENDNVAAVTEFTGNPGAAGAIDSLDSSTLNSSEQSYIRTYLFVYIALLTLVNGILGFLVLSPFSGLLTCLLLAVLLIPVGVAFFISNMMDRLITLLFRIFVAVFNVIQGLFNGLTTLLNEPLGIADTVEEAPDEAGATPDEAQPGFPGPAPQHNPDVDTGPQQPREEHQGDNEARRDDESTDQSAANDADNWNPLAQRR